MLFLIQSTFIIIGSLMIKIVCRFVTGTQSPTPKIINFFKKMKKLDQNMAQIGGVHLLMVKEISGRTKKG